MPFAPGGKGGPGRTPKEGPKWASMGYWFETIRQDLVSLTPLQRVDLAKWALEYLVENAKALPAKKSTQDQAADLLASLESSSRAGSSPSTVEVEPGQVKAKVERPPLYRGTDGG